MTIGRILLVEHALRTTESVASTLTNELNNTIQYWMGLVEHDEELICVCLRSQDRICHLPQLFRDLIYRLSLPQGTTASFSIAAREHGAKRRRQGYSAAMVVEESRLLEVSIFTTIHKNLCGLDLSRVLLDVSTIADECDSQLKQAMLSYSEPAPTCSAA